MAKFRKIPVVIDAYQWFKDTVSDDVILMEEERRVGDLVMCGLIKTLEDIEESFHYVCESDWIITGIAGEKYACKDSIFRATYEEVIEDGENKE